MFNITILLGIYFFAVGLIIGSFLNVVLYRFNTGMGVMGRSKCMSCNKTLHWYDLVPVLSFLWLRGKCRDCKSSISWQYAGVELLTGILFVLAYIKYLPLLWFAPPMFLLFTFYTHIFLCLLILILVYDMRHKIIPDAFAYAFALVALVHNFVLFSPFAAGGSGTLSLYVPSGWVMIAGPLLALPFYLIWVISDGRWMGLGDAKLALGIGWLLGLSYGGTAIIFGFWIGAAVSILIMVFYKLTQHTSLRGLSFFGLSLPRLKMKSEIPFAPFLIAGLLVVFFLNYTMFSSLV